MGVGANETNKSREREVIRVGVAWRGGKEGVRRRQRVGR